MTMPGSAFWLGAAAVGAAIAFFLLLVSALVERASPIRLSHWTEKAGSRLEALYDRPRRFEAFRFLLTAFGALAPVALFAVVERAMATSGVSAPLWAAAGVVAVFVAVTEWVSRYFVAHHAEAALDALTWPLRFLAVLALPAIALLARALPTVDADDEEDDEEDDEVSPNELEAYIDVGRREGILEPEEEALVKSIVDFGDTLVRQVMTPRVDVHAAPLESTAEELAELFFSCKHARLPVFRESIDQIVGILHIRELFQSMHDDCETDIASLAKAPLFVPESKPIRALLSELQTLHQQMAIVVDEYGGVAGLVTVEDLVEEIVGEIADEHEVEELSTETLDGGGWRVAGRTELWELAALVGREEIEDGAYETVSGLICGSLGYVPKPGERVPLAGLSFKVESADARRVITVVVEEASAQVALD